MKAYYWATRGAARPLEIANCRRRGILHLMRECKPIFAMTAAHDAAEGFPEPELSAETDCAECSHYRSPVPPEVYAQFEQAGVQLREERSDDFACALCPAPMRDRAGHCQDWEHRS